MAARGFVEVRDKRIVVRVTSEDLDAMTLAAIRSRMTVTAWARAVLDAELDRLVRENPGYFSRPAGQSTSQAVEDDESRGMTLDDLAGPTRQTSTTRPTSESARPVGRQVDLSTWGGDLARLPRNPITGEVMEGAVHPVTGRYETFRAGVIHRYNVRKMKGEQFDDLVEPMPALRHGVDDPEAAGEVEDELGGLPAPPV